MNKIKKIFFILLVISVFTGNAQNDFRILYGVKKEKVKFKFINNLVLLPVTLNGEKLTFLLDTSARKSLLFNVTTSESLDLHQVERITIRSLGERVKNLKR